MPCSKNAAIAMLALAGIAAHLVLRFGTSMDAAAAEYPLFAVLLLGGTPLVFELLRGLLALKFGSDLLAGISIVTGVLLGEYLAASLVVLMLSGGEALEGLAVERASSALAALAKRLPQLAKRKTPSGVQDVPLSELDVGDLIIVPPHEACPVDGIVVEGNSRMDESFLTGEPYHMLKVQGSEVISGSINGDNGLVVRASSRAVDSRYARIMRVMQESAQSKPRMRRLADKLGAIYTPVAVAIGAAAWLASGDPGRFLSVMVVATPCPLLIAVPVCIIGAISLAARRGIIVRNPAALETVPLCRAIVFDKTGTLTYGRPAVTEIVAADGVDAAEVISLAGSLELYSKHPLGQAIVAKAGYPERPLTPPDYINEQPGKGMSGKVAGKTVRILSRKHVAADFPQLVSALPPQSSGLECIVLIDDRFAANIRFRDAPRSETNPFISHLTRKHRFSSVMIVSGDRESEVRYLADAVGIKDVHANKSPEEKVAIVQDSVKSKPTIYVGDGINDAPALAAASVGIAIGQHSEVTSEAADIVIMEPTLKKVDEFFHISDRMLEIATQSTVGGMLASVVGMLFASYGLLLPVAGAITQEIIDLAAVGNALRASVAPRRLNDF